MPKWRLKLDLPYDFALEPGFVKAVQCNNFAALPDSISGVIQEPNTRLLMLQPSYLNKNFGSDFKALDSWRQAQNMWQKVHRAHQEMDMFTSLRSASYIFSQFEIHVDAAILLAQTVTPSDYLVWALESLFTLDRDEGFAIHYHALTDEFLRHDNFFALSWDDAFIHFSMTGVVTVFQYNDRTDKVNGGATRIDQFTICSPGELLNRAGYFTFTPIPGIGLSITHNVVSQSLTFFGASAASGVTRGHVVTFPTRSVNGYNTLFEPSLVDLAMNPNLDSIQHLLGFQNISYPSEGYYLDGNIDMQYVPQLAPAAQIPLLLNTPFQTVDAQFWQSDGTAAWIPASSKQGRIRLHLQTSDTRHTPFVQGYGVSWLPAHATRTTTSLTLSTHKTDEIVGNLPDRLTKLEFNEDDQGHFEGKATMLLSSAHGMQIAKRGDATFTLEYSLDSGTTWILVNGGLAIDWEREPLLDNFGFYYMATCSLHDMSERFKETHWLFESAHDGQTAAEAINAVLQGSSFTPIPLNQMPAGLFVELPRPADGNTWRFAPRPGDDGEKTINNILFLIRKQFREYFTKFDWASSQWNIVQKPRDVSSTGFWKLWPLQSGANVATKQWYYGPGTKIIPCPPEGNVIIVEGLTTPDAKGDRILSPPLSNEPSKNDVTSIDYLGRVKTVKLSMWPLSSQEDVNIMARRVKAAIAFHADKGTIVIPKLQMALVPNLRVLLMDNAGNVDADVWIKRRTIMVEHEDVESMTLDVDSVWEGKVK